MVTKVEKPLSISGPTHALTQQKHPPRYVGNGPYCYANSLSMLLSTIGEKIDPSTFEVLTGMGLDAFWIEKAKLLFFSSLSNSPDKGMSRALTILGFKFEENSSPKPGNPPFRELRSLLNDSPALLGPLDMGYLVYNPAHGRLAGSDHYLIAYAMDKHEVHVHDPEGYPYASIGVEDLEHAWRAERIGYRDGYYRYWTRPRRESGPSDDQVYYTALESFRNIYRKSRENSREGWKTGHEAITAFAKHVAGEKISPREAGFMVHFLFRLGARRASDYAEFFEPRHPVLSQIKKSQAQLFGRCHTFSAKKEWVRLAEALRTLSETEEEFRTAIFH